MGRHSPFIRVPVARPQEAILSLIGHLDRCALEGAIEALMERLDRMDGDTDIEANGDELDGTAGEDDFCEHNSGGLPGPGCPIADADACPAGEDDLDLKAYGNGWDDEDKEEQEQAIPRREFFK